MATRPYQYSRSPIGWMSAVVVVLWIGIWALWPSGRPAGAAMSSVSQTRVRFVGTRAATPAMSQRLVFMGDATSPDREPALAATVPTVRLVPHPRLPGLRVPRVTPSTPEANASAMKTLARSGLSGYRPELPQTTAFGAVTGGTMRLVAELSPALGARQFRVPEPLPAAIDGGDRLWSATFQVRCDRDGRVNHVFVLRISDQDAVTRQALVRMLYEAKASPGDPVEGSITFNWCRVPDADRGGVQAQ